MMPNSCKLLLCSVLLIIPQCTWQKTGYDFNEYWMAVGQLGSFSPCTFNGSGTAQALQVVQASNLVKHVYTPAGFVGRLPCEAFTSIAVQHNDPQLAHICWLHYKPISSRLNVLAYGYNSSDQTYLVSRSDTDQVDTIPAGHFRYSIDERDRSLLLVNVQTETDTQYSDNSVFECHVLTPDKSTVVVSRTHHHIQDCAGGAMANPLTNPCKFGGNCRLLNQSDTSLKRLTCTCMKTYTGSFCEVPKTGSDVWINEIVFFAPLVAYWVLLAAGSLLFSYSDFWRCGSKSDWKTELQRMDPPPRQ